MKEVGPGVTVAQPGDPVLLSFTFCNKCAICRAGHFSHCMEFDELNFGGPYNVFGHESSGDHADISGCFFGQSSFAQLSVVKQSSVVNVKDHVKDKKELQLFSPLGCGIQTGSGTVINVAEATAQDVVAVIGLGGVGLGAVMGAKIQGCRMIIGIDRIEPRLQLATELGCTHTIDGSKLGDKTLAQAVQEVADGIGPTITIDTTGVPVLIQAGVEFTRKRGKILQVGSAPFDFNLQIPLFNFMTTGKQLIGAVEGGAYPPEYVPKMIQWYREGKFPIDKLMKFIPAEDFEQGLQEMKDGSTIKPILVWS